MTGLDATAAAPAKLGTIYLPANPGTPVGTFEFIVDPDTGHGVEVGTPVAADTAEGTVVGTVVDMRTVGTERDPVRTDLGAGYDAAYIAEVREVVVATVQVFHAPAMRPVRAGFVRAATAAEMLAATGYERMDWPIPAGVVPLADGSWAKVCLDGHALLGPESAHLAIGGLSGQAAKTSFAGVLLRAAIDAGSAGSSSVAALIFNVKGEDLVFLDEPPAAGYELTDLDQAMYAALGVPATPFPDVTVFAPGLPGGTGTASARPDARPLRWDLRMLWKYLKYLLGNQIVEDEKLSSFLAEFYEHCLNNPNPAARVDTFAKLELWFDERLREAEENDTLYAWRSHHKATMWRIRRMLTGLVTRCRGLLSKEAARDAEDVPDAGWQHGQVVVVDIAGMHTDVQALVIARTCERVLKSAENGTLGVDHLVVFADELNAFAPAQGSEMSAVRKILQRISTQGRYAGISLWGAGQKLSKVDELVRDNAATRALGITVDAELGAGVYGRIPSGLAERIATLPKGQMALWHYSFRGALVVRFPRPAWRTGKAKTTGSSQRRKGVTDSLGLSARAVARLTEGVPLDVVADLVAGADDPDEARRRLEAARVPDMRTVMLHEPSSFDPDNPFDFD